MVLRYPGSKTRKLRILSPYLDWLVHGESEFAEVCVGGGPVLIHVAEKYPRLLLLANDIDPLVAAFWTAVSHKDTTEALCHQLRTVPTHEIRARLLAREPDDPVERAWAAVVLIRRHCLRCPAVSRSLVWRAQGGLMRPRRPNRWQRSRWPQKHS